MPDQDFSLQTHPSYGLAPTAPLRIPRRESKTDAWARRLAEWRRYVWIVLVLATIAAVVVRALGGMSLEQLGTLMGAFGGIGGLSGLLYLKFEESNVPYKEISDH